MQLTTGRILANSDLDSAELAMLHRCAVFAGLKDLAVEIARRWHREQPQNAGAKKAFGLIPAVLKRNRK